VSRPVPGDPASLSACGATAARAGALLAGDAERARTAYRLLGDGWPGRASVATRRAGAVVTDAASAVAAELGTGGTALQEYATDLAGLLARARQVTEQAGTLGLEVRDGRVELGWGLTGEASVEGAAAREADRRRLQEDLDAVRTLARRRRDHLLALLGASTGRLGNVADGLRAG
jgi:hypothetical protein